MIVVSLIVTAAVIFLERDTHLTDKKAIPDGREVRPREKASIPETPARAPERAETQRAGRSPSSSTISVSTFAWWRNWRGSGRRSPSPSSPTPLMRRRRPDSSMGRGRRSSSTCRWNPGPTRWKTPVRGRCSRTWMPERSAGRSKTNLTAVPYASGVNNHMGSLFMENEAGLSVVMEELAKRNLFFVDSRTTPDSLGRQAAARAGVRFAERAVFIDHHRGYSAALANLTQPHRSDWEKGRPLLLIGHPHDETIRALGEAQSHWHEGKIQVIPISAFISLPGGAEKKNALVKYR